jgi:hypothetical protein
MALQFFRKKYTIQDTGQPLEVAPVILFEPDLQIQSNSVYVGDISGQDFEISAGNDLYYNRKADLSQIFFKNKVAGSTAYVVVIGWLE